MSKEFLWVEKYRPNKVKDCILPDTTRNVFQGFVEQGELPNLLLSGTAGVGKTTIAKAMCEEIGASYIVINGSDEGRFLDTVRNRVRQFATTVSLTSGASHKVVIIDEADNTTNDVQLSLRTAVEEFHNNCRFIFTCNFINKIIEPLHSRCAVVEFGIKGKEKQKIAASFFQRLNEILNVEKIKSDKKVIVELINKHFPDWRRVLNECQRYSVGGIIDSAILAEFSDVKVNDLIKKLKEKDFPSVRKWTVSNLDNDPNLLFRRIYDALYTSLDGPSIAAAVLIIAKYQYQMAFVADQEINMLACLTEIMVECKFK